ncbi:MAG: GTPase HflX [Oscillospiraceae bacterium]|jgi:GTP-binding protein HflX|nr:GTPase HflX [Oscillospiraceae bacterium]
MVHGDLTGIRDSWIGELDQLYDWEGQREYFAPPLLVETLARQSARIRRETSLYLTRAGEVIDVTVGGASSVPLPALRKRRGTARLAGVRCLHTHPEGDARLSDVDLRALVSLRLDAMTAIGVNADGSVASIQSAFLGECVNGQPEPWLTELFTLDKLPQRVWREAIEQADAAILRGDTALDEDAPERALLIGIDSGDSLDELAALADTAGANVVGRILQKRLKPDIASYIGKGKLDEAALDAQALDADLAIADDELTGAQTRALEEHFGIRVIDRTMLILDIFAKHAHSREGRLQVELAQLSHRLPRLAGEGLALSRLGGGIGTRGPGETRLEVSRRRVRERVADLKRELEGLASERALRRSRRGKRGIPSFALVGYTNAGKSTLLNALTNAGAFACDRLFATLDPLTRKYRTPEGDECLLTDTVGFIRKLPAALVDAFHSTLEEAALADALIVVSDASAPNRFERRQVVRETLELLGAGGKPTIEVLNKLDVAGSDLADEFGPLVRISAKTGEGLDDLVRRITAELRRGKREVSVFVPYAKGGALAFLHERGQVLEESYEAEGARALVRLDEETLRLAVREGAQAVGDTGQ